MFKFKSFNIVIGLLHFKARVKNMLHWQLHMSISIHYETLLNSIQNTADAHRTP